MVTSIPGTNARLKDGAKDRLTPKNLVVWPSEMGGRPEEPSDQCADQDEHPIKQHGMLKIQVTERLGSHGSLLWRATIRTQDGASHRACREFPGNSVGPTPP